MSCAVAALLLVILTMLTDISTAMSVVKLNGSVVEEVYAQKNTIKDGVEIEIRGNDKVILSTTLQRILQREKMSVKFNDNEEYFVPLLFYEYSGVQNGQFIVTYRRLEIESSVYAVRQGGALLIYALAVLLQDPFHGTQGIMHIYGQEEKIKTYNSKEESLSIALDSIPEKNRVYKNIIGIDLNTLEIANSVSKFHFMSLKPQVLCNAKLGDGTDVEGIFATAILRDSEEGVKIEITGRDKEILDSTLRRIHENERLSVKCDDTGEYSVALKIHKTLVGTDGNFTISCRALEVQSSLLVVRCGYRVQTGTFGVLRQKPCNGTQGIMNIYGHEENVKSSIKEGRNLTVEDGSIPREARILTRIYEIQYSKFVNGVSELHFTHFKPEMYVRIIDLKPNPESGICAVLLQEPTSDNPGKLEISGKKIDVLGCIISFSLDNEDVVQVGFESQDGSPEEYAEVHDIIQPKTFLTTKLPNGNEKFTVEFKTLKKL